LTKLKYLKVDNSTEGGNELITLRYMDKLVSIKTQKSIKINGIIWSKDKKEMDEMNWNEVLAKIKNQLMKWTPRSLSILRKIQIIKTFGLSQGLYLARVLPPDKKMLQKIKNTFDHFIWSKSLTSPNRIKDEILTTPIKLGGFGMIKCGEIVTAMNIRQLFVSHRVNNVLRDITEASCNFRSILPSVTITEFIKRTPDRFLSAIGFLPKSLRSLMASSADPIVASKTGLALSK